ncbi:LysR family transcriptional regulator [Roseibium album]|uniref:Gcv operon activator n=1 Tax=Roseibium album TaxID=311410 RepID=A0A0M7AIW2_9HYPH|nr:LysR family transcriptional regulator [Roseibium album]CTQ60145.1 Gcv operon activator [Roseibium album]CTQ67133.1 Gcv operon activator [Roseibium album]CTQ74809.1 Gcv operon activator [Roseibium album]
MDWKKIPSLHALRAFETVARNKSFTAAARELNVTEAAVRQHVRGLEEWFGVSLVERKGKGVSLTKTGERLAASTSDCFQTLVQGVNSLVAAEENRPVTVALTPAFAEIWLMPRLDSFWKEHPDIEISLQPSLQLAEIRGEQFDLAIRYGLGKWPGTKTTRLASAEYVVVARPGLADAAVSRELSDLSDLKSYPWLFEASRQEHRDWAERHGIDFDARTNRHYPTNSLVIAAARAGHGVSLQSRALVQTDLNLGILEELYAEDSAPLAYYLVTRSGLSSKAREFVNWLKKAASQT